jgi:hypothetical protein
MARQYRLRKMLAVYPPTPLDRGPDETVHHEPAYEILIELDKDHTATLTVHQSDLDECPEWFEEIPANGH